MEQRADGAEQQASQEVVSRVPRWLAGAVIFAVGVGAGASAVSVGTFGTAGAAVDGSVAIGCGVVTLIVDADQLGAGNYELHASVGDRVLPMINSMTYPLIGTHRGHQSLVPDDGRLLLVANVPVGTGNALRWELVDVNSEPAVGGVLRDTCSPGG